MLFDIVEAQVIGNHTLFLRFENGVEGQVDISEHISFTGVFAKLENPDYFASVRVNQQLGTIVWDSGADLSPEYLYSVVSKKAP